MVHESLHDSEGAQTDGGQLAQGHGDRTNNRDLEMFGLVDHGVVETGWHTGDFPRRVGHRVENGRGLTKVAVVLLNGVIW